MTVAIRKLASSALFVASALIASVSFAQRASYQGIWWNPDESGWGVNLTHQDDVIFAAWFTYDASGKAVWWVASMAQQGTQQVFKGDLYQTTGPAYSAPTFAPERVTRTVVGTAQVSFAGASHANFTYTVGGVTQTKAVTPQVFRKIPVCELKSQAELPSATNYSGLWWNPDESGWGVNFAHQGDIVFATWFTYDIDGKPMWLVGSLSQTDTSRFRGVLYRTTGPAFSAVPFRPDDVGRFDVGVAEVEFANGANASWTATVNGVRQSRQIRQQVFREAVSVCRHATLPVLSTSYLNFKAVGLKPLPNPRPYMFWHGYGDFFQRGRLDAIRADVAYDFQRPIGEARPGRITFLKVEPDGSFVESNLIQGSNEGCLHPRKVVVADFNNDGRPDAFLACSGYDGSPFPGERPKVVLSRVDGTYIVKDAVNDVGYYHGAAATDVNKDGFVDVVAVDNNNAGATGLRVFLNRGDGTFVREADGRFPVTLTPSNPPPPLTWNLYTIELVDVNEDGLIDVIVGGHEPPFGAAPTLVLINPGDFRFEGAPRHVIPAVANEGVALDFAVTGKGVTRTIWVNRTSGGDGTFYRSRVIQKVAWPSLASQVVFNERPAQWFPWLIPFVENGVGYIGSDNSGDGVRILLQ